MIRIAPNLQFTRAVLPALRVAIADTQTESFARLLFAVADAAEAFARAA